VFKQLKIAPPERPRVAGKPTGRPLKPLSRARRLLSHCKAMAEDNVVKAKLSSNSDRCRIGAQSRPRARSFVVKVCD
jgi:hypothetical protein